MSDPKGPNRPVRSRAPVLTYNLKDFCGIARHTQMSTPEEQVLNCTPVVRSDTSSPLSSPMMSPQIPSESAFPPTDARDSTTSQEPKYECFNQVPSTYGHYYSALTLYAHGVWIEYLASDRQKKSFRGLPSYSYLKANFVDMSLPCPHQAWVCHPKIARRFVEIALEKSLRYSGYVRYLLL
jgi:hypothetical protein